MGEADRLGESVLVLSTDAKKLLEGIAQAKSSTDSLQADFKKAAEKMQTSMGGAHDAIKEKFAHRFRHIGVDIFGGQLLDLAGVQGRVRPIMGALELTVNQTAAAFGLAAGPIGLVTFGLAALGAIIYKVVSDKKALNAELEKMVKDQEEAFRSTKELQKATEEYGKTALYASNDLLALSNANKTLLESEKQLLAITLERQLVELHSAIDKAGDKFTRMSAGLASAGYNLEQFGLSTNGSKQLTLEQASALAQLQVEMDKGSQKVAQITEQLSRFKATGDITPLVDRVKEYSQRVSEIGDRLRASLQWANRLIDEGTARRVANIQRLDAALTNLQMTTSRSIGGMTAEWIRGQRSFKEFADGMIAKIGELVAQTLILRALGFGVGGAFGSGVVSSLIAGGMAEGGPVERGRAYVVGERGPELFVPRSSGDIIPNSQATGGVTVNQNFSIAGMDFSSAEAARGLLKTMAAQMRSGAIEAQAFARAAADQTTLNPSRAF